MYRFLPTLVLLAAVTTTLSAADAINSVVTLPKAHGAKVQLPDGSTVPAQQHGDSLVFVLPKAADTVTVKPIADANGNGKAFHFAEAKDHVDVLFGDRKVLRYMNTPRDPSTKDTHELTFKPFHHVYDPAKGDTLLTNGAGLDANKDLLFPHHRGLFFAFNKINYGTEKGVDVWHGRKNEFTLHEKMLKTEAGPVFAKHVAALSWHGFKGDTFASEERSIVTYNTAHGTMIDWSTTLSTTLPKVTLDGDPQHAGFHFRANMEVSKNGKTNTYYLRPDGKGKIGETRNWDPKGKDSKTVNLPWNAMSFVTNNQRYTVLRINHPNNPHETRGSERDYGRFGDYFEYELTPTHPLKLQYRVWVQEGEMTVEQCEAMARGFVTPVKARVQ